jgi:hypothetical protein
MVMAYLTQACTVSAGLSDNISANKKQQFMETHAKSTALH